MRRVREACPSLTGVVLNVNKHTDNVILGEKTLTLWGEPELEDRLCGNVFRLSPHAFYQVNHAQAEQLYACVLDFAGLTGAESVLDLCCGAGTITLALARKASRAVGVEIVPEAVDNARHNARLNGIDNADFRCQDATEFAMEQQEPVDVLIVDPPRKGLSEQGIRDIVRISPKRIVYVSCGPNTLKRDLERFAQSGWQARWIQPVDMFCQTPNVEAVCLLEKE